MKKLIILMSWHVEVDKEKVAAFEANRESFVRFNPDIEVITVMNAFSNSKQAWLSTDLSMFYWYIKNGIFQRSERYVLVEWDCWCDCSLEEYFGRVWDCNLVVPSIKYPERDDWYWFSTVNQLPEHARPYAVGITPFCGILISNEAMQAISHEIIKPEYVNLNSELRLGTIATMLNFDPIVNPVYTRSLGWRFSSPFDLKYKGLHHPRKYLK